MATRVTNNSGINLPLAIWLLHDEYDYIDEPKYISATGLLRPLKQTILAARVPVSQRTLDVEDLIASSLGHSIHDSVEKAWRKSYKTGMLKLGIPEKVIAKVRIDPTPEQAKEEGIIPIYLERRAFKKIAGYTVGGKFDMVADGQLYDHKSTSVYAWIFGGKDEDYSWQGSIYRWLHDDVITSDTIKINFIFTDWSKAQLRQQGPEKYPLKRVAERVVPLKSIQETEQFIAGKLRDLDRYWHAKEEDMPRCSDKELWRSAPTHKYYADPTKTSGRSTRNFDSLLEANNFCADKGKGVVITVPGEVKACAYCPAFAICQQAKEYIND